MPKGSPELVSTRREEIINACEKLYQTMSFKEITIKEIGKVTSFNRTTIYNYFHTKEEIFLALSAREYDDWSEELLEILSSNEKLSVEALADKISKSLESRVQLLKLLSMNFFEMEANSRLEILIPFKRSFKNATDSVGKLIKKFLPHYTEAEVQSIIFSFFPFMYGIYPYTQVTEKQKTAMREVDLNYKFQNIYEITYEFLIRLLDQK